MCTHLDELVGRRDAAVTPSARGCEECLEQGDSWVHLRLCMTCGHVGCCNDSPNRHAAAHFHSTKHPVIKSFEPGESWGWCYVDEEFTRSITAFPSESPPEHYASPNEPR